MFRKFAYEAQGGNWEGWTPPWEQHGRDGRHHHWGHGPHHFGMRIKRGLFGHGGPFGPEGPFNEGRRFFGRGDVKFALLELLQERPMHGYEMMKALEEKSGGIYVPSAGTIYPTLQLLEDRSLVTAQEVEGKKVYSITDAGRKLLAERQKEEIPFENPFEGRFGPRGRQWAPELHALRSEAMEVARMFAIAGRVSFNDSEKLNRLRAILERTRKELADLIYGTGSQQDPGASGSNKVE